MHGLLLRKLTSAFPVPALLSVLIHWRSSPKQETGWKVDLSFEGVRAAHSAHWSVFPPVKAFESTRAARSRLIAVCTRAAEVGEGSHDAQCAPVWP